MNAARSGWTAVLGAAVVLALPAPLDSVRWWRSYRVTGALALTAEQAEAIERIHQSMDAPATACEQEALAARRHLDRSLMADAADEAFEVTASTVADAEAGCRRLRTLMLYRMYRELSTEQRRGLAAIAARRTDRAVP